MPDGDYLEEECRCRCIRAKHYQGGKCGTAGCGCDRFRRLVVPAPSTQPFRPPADDPFPTHPIAPTGWVDMPEPARPPLRLAQVTELRQPEDPEDYMDVDADVDDVAAVAAAALEAGSELEVPEDAASDAPLERPVESPPRPEDEPITGVEPQQEQTLARGELWMTTLRKALSSSTRSVRASAVQIIQNLNDLVEDVEKAGERARLEAELEATVARTRELRQLLGKVQPGRPRRG